MPPLETCLQRSKTLINQPLTVFLSNGVKLDGCITELMEDGLILTRDGTSQLVFKQAIATILPQGGNVRI